jgi:hypothetical protein
LEISTAILFLHLYQLKNLIHYGRIGAYPICPKRQTALFAAANRLTVKRAMPEQTDAVCDYRLCMKQLFLDLKIIFWRAADGTFPVIRNIFKSGSSIYAIIGIALFRIIDIATNCANPFIHLFLLCMCVNDQVEPAGRSSDIQRRSVSWAPLQVFNQKIIHLASAIATERCVKSILRTDTHGWLINGR